MLSSYFSNGSGKTEAVAHLEVAMERVGWHGVRPGRICFIFGNSEMCFAAKLKITDFTVLIKKGKKTNIYHMNVRGRGSVVDMYRNYVFAHLSFYSLKSLNLRS